MLDQLKSSRLLKLLQERLKRHLMMLRMRERKLLLPKKQLRSRSRTKRLHLRLISSRLRKLPLLLKRPRRLLPTGRKMPMRPRRRLKLR